MSQTLKLFSFVSQCQSYQQTESGTGQNIWNKKQKISRRGSRGSLTKQNLVISCCCFAEDGKET